MQLNAKSTLGPDVTPTEIPVCVSPLESAVEPGLFQRKCWTLIMHPLMSVQPICCLFTMKFSCLLCGWKTKSTLSEEQ